MEAGSQVTVISLLTYSVIYLFPMLGFWAPRPWLPCSASGCRGRGCHSSRGLPTSWQALSGRKPYAEAGSQVTVISWLTYPVVYLFPMLGFAGAEAVVAIQCGYCASVIISKCGVGLTT